MSNPAFIVDGFTEKYILEEICPGKRISRLDLNGKSVTVEAIAKKISSIVRLYNNRHYPIIILIDRECRNETAHEIAELLKLAIESNGVIGQDLRIGAADRMIENWIIADWNCLQIAERKPPTTDGLNGASIIKKVKGSYKKTTDGIDLFLKADPNTIKKNSPSFKEFINKLTDIECGYIKRIDA